MKKTIENDAILIADSHHGQYIPQLVVEGELNNPNWNWTKCNKEDIDVVLDGVENEFYWDAWCDIEDSVEITDNEGTKYFLIFNEDLWAVPDECADQLEEWII
jgi:hypothetical protein